MEKVDSIWNQLFYLDATSPSGLRWRDAAWSKCGRRGHGAGDAAGYVHTDLKNAARYWVVRTPKSLYSLHNTSSSMQVHRIIMAIKFGDDSIKDLSIDHINGDSLDNRIENLRIVTNKVNNQNRKMRSNNTTGVTGVTIKTMGNHSYYAATWKENDKHMCKFFSITKLGESEAFQQACNHRSKMIEQLNQSGESYSDRHGS